MDEKKRSVLGLIKDFGGVEVDPFDVYDNIFGLTFDDSIQEKNGEKKDLKANPIGYYKNDDEEHGHFLIMYRDEFKEDLKILQEADFAILNCNTYFGRRNLMAHASKAYGMIFDYDGVTPNKLYNFLYGALKAGNPDLVGPEGRLYPVPNYIAMSGHGLHLYYYFDEPIPLYPNVKNNLKRLKYALTDKMWNKYTSAVKRQKQGIGQGFRVLGGKTKKDAKYPKVRVFKVYDKPYTLEELCAYIPYKEVFPRNELKKMYDAADPEHVNLSMAKEKWPEWYQHRIVNKEKNTNRWKIEDKVNGQDPYALYHWWIRKILDGASYGHRYYCVMCLAIYALKCGYPFKKLEADAYGLIPFLNSINPDNPFTKEDVREALTAYKEAVKTFPRKDIEELTEIKIPANKRNGRTQEQHLKIMRLIEEVMYPDGTWRNKNGRPSVKNQVIEYMTKNPDARKIDCIKNTGLSKSSVYKYWEDGLEARCLARKKELAAFRNKKNEELKIKNENEIKTEEALIQEMEAAWMKEKLEMYSPLEDMDPEDLMYQDATFDDEFYPYDDDDAY